MNLQVKVRISDRNFVADAKEIALGTYHSDTQCWNVNYTYVLSRLIQEAGRWCPSYVSDLFDTWKDIDKDIKDGTLGAGQWFFAFSYDGIEGYQQVKERCEHDPCMRAYAALWVLDIRTNTFDTLMEMRLVRVL